MRFSKDFFSFINSGLLVNYQLQITKEDWIYMGVVFIWQGVVFMQEGLSVFFTLRG